MTSAAGVKASTAPAHGAGPGSTPRAALHDLYIAPIPISTAKKLVKREHYLHSLPGGTPLAFGAFLGSRLQGTITLGIGPYHAHSLVDGGRPDDCSTLTRFWLSDQLPTNSESHVMAIVFRALKRYTSLKFLVTYADPGHGHLGTIYQATNWTHTGLSEATPLYDLDDGHTHHPRSFAHTYGSRSLQHFRNGGVDIKLVPQRAKHRYINFLDPSWRSGLTMPVLPYPKKELR